MNIQMSELMMTIHMDVVQYLMEVTPGGIPTTPGSREMVYYNQ